jgi:hypothetical protein
MSQHMEIKNTNLIHKIIDFIIAIIITSSTLFLSNNTFAQYTLRANGDIVKCDGACSVYPDNPSVMAGTSNSLCFRELNQKGGAWVLSTKKVPQQAKCIYAGGYVDKDHYLYCEDYNCDATIMGNIINIQGIQEKFPSDYYPLEYNFSLFCKANKWIEASDSVFLCGNSHHPHSKKNGFYSED